MGMAIRNNFGLWEKHTLLVNDMNKRFSLYHGDDFSSLILEAVWARVKNLKVEDCLNEKIESFKKHWIKQGIDPKTGEKL